MKSLNELLEIYNRYHTQSTNKISHYIGIPLVVLALLMLLSWFRIEFFGLWKISFATIAILALLIYYYFLNIRLAALATVLFIIVGFIASLLAGYRPSLINFIIFLILASVGVLLQFLGHQQETKQSNFFKEPIYLIISPLFIIIEGLKKLGYEKYFNIYTIPSSNQTSSHFDNSIQ